MSPEAFADALAATSVGYMFLDRAIASMAIDEGHIAITFNYLNLADLQQRRWPDIERKAQASHRNRPGERAESAIKGKITSDVNWLRWFLGAREDALVVTRHDGALWWACFGDATVLDTDQYRYRRSRRGWQRLEGQDKEALHPFHTWLTTSRPTAANYTIEEFKNLLQAQYSSELASRSEKLLASARELANRAFSAALQSGTAKGGVYKDKNFGFDSKDALEAHILQLFEKQGGRCALTGLELVLHGMDTTDVEHECLVSLDRITSDGHYSASNLQLVCSFANRWKGTSDHAHMTRLLQLVRAVETAH